MSIFLSCLLSSATNLAFIFLNNPLASILVWKNIEERTIFFMCVRDSSSLLTGIHAFFSFNNCLNSFASYESLQYSFKALLTLVQCLEHYLLLLLHFVQVCWLSFLKISGAASCTDWFSTASCLAAVICRSMSASTWWVAGGICIVSCPLSCSVCLALSSAMIALPTFSPLLVH